MKKKVLIPILTIIVLVIVLFAVLNIYTKEIRTTTSSNLFQALNIKNTLNKNHFEYDSIKFIGSDDDNHDLFYLLNDKQETVYKMVLEKQNKGILVVDQSNELRFGMLDDVTTELLNQY